MPGPVSDSFDPEFGTGEAYDELRDGISAVLTEITKAIGSPNLRYIVDVAREEDGVPIDLSLSERELRIVRFGLLRALETL